MSLKLIGGKIYNEGMFCENEALFFGDTNEDGRVVDCGSSIILPALCDVHVHLREPGGSHKETIKTGTMAAARGGYTVLGAMPNLDPPPTDMASLQKQLDIIERDAAVKVIPYGAITSDQSGRGKLSDMEAMAPYVIAFTDDGLGVQAGDLMREAMERAKTLSKLIVAHCEDEEFLAQGKVRESEWRQIERDVKLADEVGAGYHVCHISTKESVEIIRDAKKSGVNVSCETAPHYLLLDDRIVEREVNRYPEKGGRYKMNPPIKTPKDREALVEGAVDGTIDMVATDHAPHSDEEKSRGFAKSLNGVTGLDCAMPVLYGGLVKSGDMTLERLVEMTAVAPRKRFGIAQGKDFIVFDPNVRYRIDSGTFLSMGKWTPFDGAEVFGRVKMTFMDGKLIFEDREQ